MIRILLALRVRGRRLQRLSISSTIEAIPGNREINRGIEAKARTAILAFAACGQFDLRGSLHKAQYSEIGPASASFAVLELS